MDNLPEEITTAVFLAPLVKRLEDAGIMTVHNGQVLICDDLFHETFHTWYTKPVGGQWERHIHKVNGVEVCCLARKEGS